MSSRKMYLARYLVPDCIKRILMTAVKKKKNFFCKSENLQDSTKKKKSKAIISVYIHEPKKSSSFIQ